MKSKVDIRAQSIVHSKNVNIDIDILQNKIDWYFYSNTNQYTMEKSYQEHIIELHRSTASNFADLPNLSTEALKQIITHYEKILALLLQIDEPK